jgi:peroxiredoxin
MNMKYWNLISAIILVVGAAWTAVSAPKAGDVTEGQTPAPRQGFLAPDFELENESGQKVRLSDFRGQPVLINFWASWCPPCQAEMPAMQQVHDAYAKQGYVILAVNTTFQDQKTAALAFVQEHGLTFPILFDLDGKTSNLYAVRSMPTSFFIDTQGIIRDVVIGGPMSEGLLRSQAERMLEEP